MIEIDSASEWAFGAAPMPAAQEKTDPGRGPLSLSPGSSYFQSSSLRFWTTFEIRP